MLPNSFKSALVPFFANIPLRTGWRGEMRYGLLNDARVLDKDAWPLMVERYVALAYDNGVMRCAKDLPQPLLWAAAAGQRKGKSRRPAAPLTCPTIGLSSASAPARSSARPNAGRTITMLRWRKSLSTMAIRLRFSARRKITRPARDHRRPLSSEQQAWCRNLAGETQLEQAVILIAACKAVVTNDSGLMHVAAALDRPLVALYGPSSPTLPPPLSHKARVIRLITGYHKVRKGDAAEGYHHRA